MILRFVSYEFIWQGEVKGKVKWQELGSWEHFMRIHPNFCSLTFAKRAMKEDHSEQKYKSILKRIVRGVGIHNK
jgi:hypothetical protein